MLRVVAMLMVIVIHATGLSEWNLVQGSATLQDWIAVLLNQLARFSVPLFVLLSGYGLSLGRYENLWLWLRHRGAKILLPYLVWTLGIDAVLGKSFHWLQLIRGNAWYHFYFFPVLIQCYGAFLVLRKLPDRWFHGVVGFFLGVQILSYAPLARWVGMPVAPSFALHYWLGYFLVGMWLARRREIRPVAAGWWVLAVLLAYGRLVMQFLEKVLPHVGHAGIDPGWWDHFHRLPVLVLTLALVGLVVRVNDRIPYVPWVSRLASISFFVYLSHALWLPLLNRIPGIAGHSLLLIVVLSGWTVACGLFLNGLFSWRLLPSPLRRGLKLVGGFN